MQSNKHCRSCIQYTHIIAIIHWSFCIDIQLYTSNRLFHSIAWVFFALFGFLYSLQLISIFFVWFARMIYIFKNTQLRVSTHTIRIWLTFTSLLVLSIVICAICIVVFPSKLKQIQWILIGVVGLYILDMLSLFGLFVSKLIRTYQDATLRDTNSKLIRLITKVTVLNMTSLLGTLIAAASPLMKGYGHTPLSISIFINYVCILLSYKHCSNYYYQVCCCCNCDVLFTNMYAKKRNGIIQHIENVEATSSQSDR
eukprot:577844_1